MAIARRKEVHRKRAREREPERGRETTGIWRVTESSDGLVLEVMGGCRRGLEMVMVSWSVEPRREQANDDVEDGDVIGWCGVREREGAEKRSCWTGSGLVARPKERKKKEKEAKRK
ncbi:hypothetical protein CRG98_011128 [Punica granatum]|uniref:Uncharacterized protein n=1 Tax=Punica granatum TaxID=22663 RepID=A0A2I0KJJ6_PUNGR|nr:hypothetical protein CRG98_011128 [Punica granatum]